MDELPKPSRRVAAAAADLGLAIDIRIMPATTRTAAEAATACGCTVRQIVKSLIFKGKNTGKPYLFLVSGANRVDEARVAGDLGEDVVRPDAAFVREVTGFAIGGVPPLGHDRPIVPYIDRDLLAFETVWAAAGTPKAVFAVDPRQLAKAIGAETIVVA